MPQNQAEQRSTNSQSTPRQLLARAHRKNKKEIAKGKPITCTVRLMPDAETSGERHRHKKKADNIEVPTKDNNITGDISTLDPAYGIKSVKSDDYHLIYIKYLKPK